ncbi:alpha-mannosidase [Nitrosomonas communis]|uniref:Alpha mannosidase, middle domain n=1 Tax=Nitrosomonas communis TaxID=44574 RepID=A0A1H2WSZ8_9PROT|nr:glycoside hydrolase family 38 C-terminal domain-containing protein [Nitrosomonas communis]SDW83760.1 Alpha mannosidase, middle domain [Nitrosomonas communis]
MKMIHVISHAHWDREWYRTFQQFRLRLVHLVDGLLDLLAKDDNYKHFMLDGQTIVLDDYLLMRPEAEAILKKNIRKERILIGPWHILPDMFLVSPEAHIRNLLAGAREARKFGQKMRIGYLPDSFGHIGQMPQILRGFGIDNACVWRGLDDQPAEFWWQAPDGSRVLMMYLRDSYSNGAGLNADNPAQFTEQIKQAADSLAPHSVLSHLLVMYGTDHMEPPAGTSKAIQAANEYLNAYCAIHSSLPAYLKEMQTQIAEQKLQLPVVTGELRSCKRSPLLPGVLSARMWIKQRNHTCENLLEKWAEPLSVFASLMKLVNKPAPLVRQAWQLLMECHPHDSICGCSIDQVHEEMKTRFDQVEQIGEEITKQNIDALASVINTEQESSSPGPKLSAIIAFNPLSFPRTDVVSASMVLPANISDFEIVDEAGNRVPHQSASEKITDLINVHVSREKLGSLLGLAHEGRISNLAVQAVHFEREGATMHIEAIFAENKPPEVGVWNKGMMALREFVHDASIEIFHIHARSPQSTDITFVVNDVPALGWKTFYLCAKQNNLPEIKVSPAMRSLAPLVSLPLVQKLIARLSRRTCHPPYVIENTHFVVELELSERTLTITDKTTAKKYRGLHRFVDSGDCGDEYNFSPPLLDSTQDLPALCEVNIVRGAVQQVITVSLEMNIPARLNADRKSRSSERVKLPITTTITLINGVPRVDIHTRVNNAAKDHRLRVHFPFSTEIEFAQFDGHFEIVKRKIGIPLHDAAWVEEPRPEAPQRAFTSAVDMSIANRGLPEVEVTSRHEIALTLLRCVGWLSRDDFSTRTGHAGPFLETPKAQMQGEWEFDYSIILNQSNFQQAWSFDVPLRVVSTDLHRGMLAGTGSFVTVDHPSLLVSAVKETDDGRGWLVRGYNIGDEEIEVTITPWRKFGKSARVNMAEQTISPLEIGRNGEITVSVHSHEVASILFEEG